MTVARSTLRGETVYRFDYLQEFALPTGEAYEIKLSNLTFGAGRDESRTKRLDAELEARGPSLAGRLFRAGASSIVSYAICPPETLRLWTIDVELEDGSFLRLEERHDPPPTVNDTGPASLVAAKLELRGVSREVTDNWKLVYAAARHNRNVSYWIVLDPPVEIEGIERPVRIVEVIAPEPVPPEAAEAVRYLDANGEVLASPRVLAYRREELRVAGSRRFVRGDVSVDGHINLTDAIQLLEFLFRGGDAPGCEQAADANDDGRINLSDAAQVLLHLVGGSGDLPAPFPDCGIDPTDDALDCAVYAGCE